MAAPGSVALPAWSQRLIAELNACDVRVQRLTAGLTPNQLNWCPAAGSWSIGQCINHLLVTNQFLLQTMTAALERQPQRRVEAITPGWFGRWFINTYIKPSPETKQAKAPGKISPPAQIEPSVISTFLDGNRSVRDLIARAADYDVNRIRYKNPFVPLIRFTIGTGFEIISKHEDRHLLQAERVRQTPGFPTA